MNPLYRLIATIIFIATIPFIIIVGIGTIWLRQKPEQTVKSTSEKEDGLRLVQ